MENVDIKLELFRKEPCVFCWKIMKFTKKNYWKGHEKQVWIQEELGHYAYKFY